MNVVLALTTKVDQFRNRLFLNSISHLEKVFLHAARLTVSRSPATERIRVWILVRATGIAEAEAVAEARLQEILRSYQDAAQGEIELRRLKPRELTAGTLAEESAGVLNLLQTMRFESSRLVSAVDIIESSQSMTAIT